MAVGAFAADGVAGGHGGLFAGRKAAGWWVASVGVLAKVTRRNKGIRGRVDDGGMIENRI